MNISASCTTIEENSFISRRQYIEYNLLLLHGLYLIMKIKFYKHYITIKPRLIPRGLLRRSSLEHIVFNIYTSTFDCISDIDYIITYHSYADFCKYIYTYIYSTTNSIYIVMGRIVIGIGSEREDRDRDRQRIG